MEDLKASMLVSSKDASEKSIKRLVETAKARLEKDHQLYYTEGYVDGLEAALALLTPLFTTVETLYREKQ